jgi:hypothetical protein
MGSQLSMSQTHKIIKYIDSFLRYLSYKPVPEYLKPANNTKVWDGLTRNDFKKGDLISFLYKIGAIKRLTYAEDDGRAYFIGDLDED